MKEFIKLQYELYLSGGNSVGIEKIKRLAEIYLTADEQNELFGGDDK